MSQTIYVVGGYGSSGTLLTNMEKYDILTNTWTVITTNAKYYQSLVYGRWGAFSANIHNRLYVGTGIDSSNMVCLSNARRRVQQEPLCPLERQSLKETQL